VSAIAAASRWSLLLLSPLLSVGLDSPARVTLYDGSADRDVLAVAAGPSTGAATAPGLAQTPSPEPDSCRTQGRMGSVKAVLACT
jgi:hypothetical protein